VREDHSPALGKTHQPGKRPDSYNLRANHPVDRDAATEDYNLGVHRFRADQFDSINNWLMS